MKKQIPNKSWYLDHGSRGCLENSLKEAIWQRPERKEASLELGACGKECHREALLSLQNSLPMVPNEKLYL